MQNEAKDKNTELRKHAEKIVQNRQADYPETSELSPEETQRLIHELRTHQIELEMQNEELRRSQSELDASRNKYQNLYNFAPVGYFTLNYKTMILEANLTGADMLGVEKSNLIYSPFSRFIIRDTGDAFYFHIQKLFKTKVRQTFELKLKNQSGAEFYALLECAIAQESEGDSRQIRIAVSNIDAYKQTEKALRKSEEKYQALFNTSPMGLVLCRMNGELIDVNPAYAKIIGQSVEETLKLTYWDITPRKYADQEQKQLESLKTTGCYGPYEKEYIHKDGHLVPVRLNGQIVTRDGEQLIWSSVEDITDHKQAEAEALAHAERFRIFFSSVNDAIFVHPLKKAGFAPFIEVNDIACERYGYSREEFLQLSASDITKKPDAIAHSKPNHRNKLLETGRMVFETVHIKKSGETFPVEINSNIVYQFGKPVILAVVRDITERKQAGESLLKSERKYKNLVENSLMAVVQAHIDGEIVFANQKAAEFLGYEDVQELINEYDSSKAYLGEHQRPEMLAKIKQDGFFINREQEFLIKNGSSIWLLQSAFLDRETDIITTMAVDITERKQAEKALKQSRDQFESILSNIQCVTYRCKFNKDWTMTYMSPHVDLLTGYPPGDFINSAVRTYESIIHREDTEYVNKSVNEAVESGKSWEIEYRICHKDGSILWVYEKGRGKALTDSGEQYLDGFIINTTERKQAEDALRQSLKLTNEIMAQSPVGISVYDASGQCIAANDAIAALVGTDKNRYLSQNWRKLQSWKNTGMFDAAKRSTEQRIRKRFEFQGVSSFGKTVMADCHFTPLDGNQLLLIAIDITDIKAKEEELKHLAAELNEHKQNLEKLVDRRTDDLRIANAELSRANRLKDEFLANMSHELRTPLTAVLGMSEALIDQVYGPLNEKQIKSLQLVESSGKHLLSLINDILDLSKINAGKMELQIGHVSVEAVCQVSLKMIKQIAQKKKQTLFVNIDSRLIHIRADMLRLKQMLVNLLMNAVKFTPDSGKIGLEANYAPHLNRVEFAVWDTGIGISRENMKKLFKPFVQIDGGFTRKHKGTGLGLALVYKLAEMHGGSVSVESEEGKFSRFTIILPHHPDQDPANGKDLRNVENLGGLTPRRIDPKHRARILLADDNMDNIETVAGYLKAKGYDISLAYDGAQAVKMAFEEKPDIILMDIQMPGMDGLEAIRKIRNRESELQNDCPKSEIKRIPIIALTALAMRGDKEKCLETGADEYISKPAELKMLAGMIEELIVEL